MKKNKSILLYPLFLFFLLSLAVFIGIKTNYSYINDISLEYLKSNSSSLNFTIVPYIGKELIDEKISTITDLENNSDLVAKIEVSEERIFKTKTLLTKCKIKKIYKSKNDLSENDYIYIYEPANYTFSYKSFNSTNGYNYMKTNNEYIVFLNNLNTPTNYKKSNIESLSYTFIDSSFAKFSINSDSKVIYVSNDILNTGKNYGNFIDYEYIFTSHDIENKYNNFRSEILNYYLNDRRN